MAEPVPVDKDVVASNEDQQQQQQPAARSSSSSSSSPSNNNNGRRRNQTQQQPPRQAVPPLQKELKKLPKEIIKALPSLKTPENYELALQGKPIKWKDHNFFEAFHVVRMEQTIGTKKRVEVSLSLEDYNKMPKRTKAFYKFNILAVSYVLICKTCKHPRNPLIVNPEMKRKRPNTRRGTEAGRGGANEAPAASPSGSRAAAASRSRSKSVGSAPEDDFIEQVDPAVAEEMEKEREERRRLRRERREKRAAEEKKKQEEAAAAGGGEAAPATEEKKEQQQEGEKSEEKKAEEEAKKEDGEKKEAEKVEAKKEEETKKVEEETKKEEISEEKKEKVEEKKPEETKKEEPKADEKKQEETSDKQEAQARDHRREKQKRNSGGSTSSGGGGERSKGKERDERDDSDKLRIKTGGRAQDRLGGATPRAGTPNGPNVNAELFSKQNNPYEYNSYDVYVEPCACAKTEYMLEFLIKTEISNKVGVSIGMLLLNLPTMGVAFALYSDGPVMQSRKMFAFDLLSTHEQNMSIKTVL